MVWLSEVGDVEVVECRDRKRKDINIFIFISRVVRLGRFREREEIDYL